MTTFIYDGIIDSCRSAPEQIAMIEGDRKISYSQFLQQARQISNQLTEAYRTRIACAMDRGIDAAIAVYGISMAGACYVPLDIKNPYPRLANIVQQADVQWVIGSGPCPDWLSDGTKWLNFHQMPVEPTLAITPKNITDQNHAAILFTSGTSGQPKGVTLSHHAICNFANWAKETFKLNSATRIASLTPFHFDLSIFDLFSGLAAGACVIFMPSSLTLAPSRLSLWLQHNRITTWYTVPSILAFLTRKGALQSTLLPELKQILFAGEVFNTETLMQLCELLPNVDFYNLYGPTETNVCCYWPVNRNRLNTAQAIPIGLPACNAELRIDTETNELQVASDNNFSGYWQDGQLHPIINEQKFYTTGDKVSINEYGEYCYHGRLDRMLKCAGYRVEPAEIESVINQIVGVQNCVVIGINDPASGQRPAAALLLNTGFDLSAIIPQMRQLLPNYMQPVKIKVLTTLPLLSNGKINYQQIQDLFSTPEAH